MHKLECKQLKKIAPKILPDAARLLARLIQKLNKGGGNQKSHYTPTKFRMFKDLMSRKLKTTPSPNKKVLKKRRGL